MTSSSLPDRRASRTSLENQLALTPSTMAPLGTPCPTFELTDIISGRIVKDADFTGRPLLVMFICNHCPFVVHIQEELGRLAHDYSAREAGIVGICSNDAESYPADAPPRMSEMAHQQGWQFPYLHDSTQNVARSFGAACTPDFFIFDSGHRLAYRGQLDESRPKNGLQVTGSDVRNAIDALLAGKSPEARQLPSMGCNIKWRAESQSH